MEEKTIKQDSVKAGIEPAEVQATPRQAPLPEGAVSAETLSELNAIMDELEKAASATAVTEPLAPLLDVSEINFDDLEATAAGLGSGSGGDGSSFVRLLRITEGVNPLEFNYVPPTIFTIELPDEGTTQSVAETVREDVLGEPIQPPEVPEVESPVISENPQETPDPEEPEVPPVQDEDEVVKDNNGHGNNTDGQDDNNPGQGSGGPNSDPKDGEDEDEGQPGNQGDDTPGVGNNGNTEVPVEPDPDIVDSGDSDTPTEQTTVGRNPGNDKEVGNSKWDGETGASGNPGKGQHQDGIDTDENQPGGKEKGQNLTEDDLFDDTSNGFSSISASDIASLHFNNLLKDHLPNEQ